MYRRQANDDDDTSPDDIIDNIDKITRIRPILARDLFLPVPSPWHRQQVSTEPAKTVNVWDKPFKGIGARRAREPHARPDTFNFRVSVAIAMAGIGRGYWSHTCTKKQTPIADKQFFLQIFVRHQSDSRRR